MKESVVIKTVARKEFKELLRDGRFQLMAGLILVLLLVALGAGWKHYHQARTERSEAKREAREIWLAQGAKNPHSAAHFGSYAFKPLLSLSLVDQGTDPYTGAAIYLEAHKQNNAKYLPAQDGLGLQRFGELTAATVMQMLTPLVIILLAFPVFAAERESGTLRQLLSLGAPLRGVAIGKWLGVTSTLLLLLFPASVLGVMALAFGAETDGDFPNVRRVFWMVVGYLLYFGFFIGLSFAVSARARSSQLALVILLGFWVVGTLIVPRVAAEVSKRIAPIPSSAQFWTEIDHDLKSGGIDGHDSSSHDEALRRKILNQYGVEKVENLPFNFAGVALQAGEEFSNRIYDEHFTRLWDGYERQGRIQAWATILSPILGIRSISMGMAGTDFAHHRRFAADAEQYRRRMVKMLNDDVAYSLKGEEWNYLADRSMWEKLGDFEYFPPASAWALRKQAVSLGLLVVWFLAVSGAAFYSISKMRVS